MTIWDMAQPYLSREDIKQLRQFAEFLPYIADVCQADVFIDCAVSADMQEAMVMAQAFPGTARSLYRSSVVGQPAHAVNEPGVIACLQTGKPITGSRGVSQEFVAIEQNVVPIKNRLQTTIGCLIIEKDITANVRQELHVELLTQTTERLGSTLMDMAMSEPGLPTLIQEGMLLFDEEGTLTFANEMAVQLLRDAGISRSVIGSHAEDYFFGGLLSEVLRSGGVRFEEQWLGHACLKLKAAAFSQRGRIMGGMLLIRDQSELKEKEKKIVVQSAVIREIHHRVKNNLQTVSSLLNLQARRLKHPELQTAFRESINRINSLSLVHDMLARQGLEETDASELLDRITKLLVASMAKPGQRIEMSLHAEPLAMTAEQATQLALVVNELIQNSMTHAFAPSDDGWIVLELREANGMVTVSYQDSGPGMTHPKADESHLGMQIIRTLVMDGLHGTLHHGDAPNGFRLTITFPYVRKEEAHGSPSHRSRG